MSPFSPSLPVSNKGRVVVAMSGGVDSSVAAALLLEQGYECLGVFMRVGIEAAETTPPTAVAQNHSARICNNEEPRASARAVPRRDRCRKIAHSDLETQQRRLRHGCCSATDAVDARTVAGKLGIPFYALNFQADFEKIIDYFVDEYIHARTPNPCIVCNTRLKFGKLLDYADTMDAEFIATGHYARVIEHDGQPCLARSLNAAKDQTYVLHGIRRSNLRRCLFPLGEMGDKADVRRIASQLGLRVHDKPESQEICFVPDDDYKRLLRQRRPDTQRPGEVRDAAGNVLGRHEGIVNYTIGQRRGLGIAAGEPIYVTKLDAESNIVTVGPREEILSGGLVAGDVNWLTDVPPMGEWHPALVKIRHQHQPTAGSFRVLAGNRVQARFDEPQSAVTPGQAAVLYRNDGVVLAGGWIESSTPTTESAQENSG